MKAGAVDFIEKPFDDEILLSRYPRRARTVTTRSTIETRKPSEIQTGSISFSRGSGRFSMACWRAIPNKTIAYDLKLSPRTVEVHRANVMAKMGATSLSGLVRMAVQAKVLPAVKFAQPGDRWLSSSRACATSRRRCDELLRFYVNRWSSRE